MVARAATFNTLPDDVDPDAAAILRKTVRETPASLARTSSGRPPPKSISITIFEDAETSRGAAEALDERTSHQMRWVRP